MGKKRYKYNMGGFGNNAWVILLLLIIVIFAGYGDNNYDECC